MLKNGIDWLSRLPAHIGAVGKRQVAIIGASSGGLGTILSQSLAASAADAGRQPRFGGGDGVAGGQVFNEGGEMVDEKVKAQLEKFLQGFVAALQRQ